MNKHFKRHHARKNNLHISLAEFTCGLARIFIKIRVIITKNGPFPRYTFMVGIEKFYLQILRGTLSTDRDRWRMACCSAAGSQSSEHGHSSFPSCRNMLSATQKDPGWQKAIVFTIASRDSSWIQHSKTNQEQEVIAAQHFTVSFSFSSWYFPGSQGSSSAWLCKTRKSAVEVASSSRQTGSRKGHRYW